MDDEELPLLGLEDFSFVTLRKLRSTLAYP